jgi:3D (Asp-Asp-Asp) domain-containing protein
MAAPTVLADSEWQEYVRVTFYTISGTMRWGSQTYLGAAACGSYFPAGTKLMFDDEWTVTCEDTGHLQYAHVDVWVPSYAWGVNNVAQAYGDYTWVTVVRWGW